MYREFALKTKVIRRGKILTTAPGLIFNRIQESEIVPDLKWLSNGFVWHSNRYLFRCMCRDPTKKCACVKSYSLLFCVSFSCKHFSYKYFFTNLPCFTGLLERKPRSLNRKSRKYEVQCHTSELYCHCITRAGEAIAIARFPMIVPRVKTRLMYELLNRHITIT